MHDENAHARRGRTDDQPLKAVIERYDDRPNQCTIYRRDGDGVDQTAAWITAEEDAFCHLETVR